MLIFFVLNFTLVGLLSVLLQVRVVCWNSFVRLVVAGDVFEVFEFLLVGFSVLVGKIMPWLNSAMQTI